MLAYSLRKYAGVRSYVLPMDLRDSQTWGNMDVEWDMQNQVTPEEGGIVFLKGTARSLEQKSKRCIILSATYIFFCFSPTIRFFDF